MTSFGTVLALRGKNPVKQACKTLEQTVSAIGWMRGLGQGAQPMQQGKRSALEEIPHLDRDLLIGRANGKHRIIPVRRGHAHRGIA